MREIILREIEEIKSQQHGFIGDKWLGFKIGYMHITELEPNGMPDELLLVYYRELINWIS